MTEETNHFQLAKNVKNYMIDELAKYLTYQWPADFIYSEMDELKKKIAKEIPFIDFACMNTSQLRELGFKRWDDRSEFLLIPLWAYTMLKTGTELHCISGEAIKVADGYQDNCSENYIDNDQRFGCLAYGIKPVSKN